MAELGRGRSNLPQKEVAQGPLVGVAARLGDVCDGIVGGGKQFPGACKPSGADFIVDGASGGGKEALLRRAQPQPHGPGDVRHADAVGQAETDAFDAARDAGVVRAQDVRALAADDAFDSVGFGPVRRCGVGKSPRKKPDGEFAGPLEVGQNAGERRLGVLAAELVVVDTNGYLVDELKMAPKYWGFFQLTDEQFDAILKKGEVDESIIIN